MNPSLNWSQATWNITDSVGVSSNISLENSSGVSVVGGKLVVQLDADFVTSNLTSNSSFAFNGGANDTISLNATQSSILGADTGFFQDTSGNVAIYNVTKALSYGGELTADASLTGISAAQGADDFYGLRSSINRGHFR